MSSAPREWKLSTRTVRDDYFWIDHRLQPREAPRAIQGVPNASLVAAPALYTAIAEASDYRRGFLCGNGRTLSMAVDRLGAQRTDRYGGDIKHVLWLTIGVHDVDAADALRKLFAEAVADPSPWAENTVAARLARELFERWNRQREVPSSAAPVDWFKAYRELGATPAPVVTSPAVWGIQYSRRAPGASAPANLAALAARDSFHEPGLIVIAGTKYPDQINRAVRTVLDSPPRRFSFCCLSAVDGRPADLLSSSVPSPSSGNGPMKGASNMRQKVGRMLERFIERNGVVLLGVAIVAILGALLYFVFKSGEPTAPPAPQLPDSSTLADGARLPDDETEAHQPDAQDVRPEGDASDSSTVPTDGDRPPEGEIESRPPATPTTSPESAPLATSDPGTPTESSQPSTDDSKTRLPAEPTARADP